MNAYLPELLSLIHRRASISSLLEKGLTASQIAALLSELEVQQLARVEGRQLVITDAGKRVLSTSPLPHLLARKADWISHPIASQIERIDPFEAWLPAKAPE